LKTTLKTLEPGWDLTGAFPKEACTGHNSPKTILEHSLEGSHTKKVDMDRLGKSVKMLQISGISWPGALDFLTSKPHKAQRTQGMKHIGYSNVNSLEH